MVPFEEAGWLRGAFVAVIPSLRVATTRSRLKTSRDREMGSLFTTSLVLKVRKLVGTDCRQRHSYDR